MGFYFVDPETYKKYRDEVMQYSQSVQVNYQEFLPEEKRQPGYPINRLLKNWVWKNGSSGRFVLLQKGILIPSTSGRKPWSLKTTPVEIMPSLAFPLLPKNT